MKHKIFNLMAVPPLRGRQVLGNFKYKILYQVTALTSTKGRRNAVDDFDCFVREQSRFFLCEFLGFK
ncbi:hypothetical protein LDG_6489 [Legionella drancourtii LLAP12]|uniref:Uncharacterized protein n=1 Tax=Legionella drancourtii LLAP12 TaxID=658187 RepID=G9EMM1_9GAMM|nr:hypothetical protein LDG_6489 [Legionella drancourtii LLAP12]